VAYRTFLFVKINNWASDLNVGQIGGVAVNPSDQPVIFHRGPVEWNAKSFNLLTNNLAEPRTRIDEDTILTLDPDSGKQLSSWGKGMFYMPHGLTIDGEGNTYVTDVGLHQVMRFPAGKTTPDLVLGVAFESGNDEKHFCKPTDVAVSERNGDFFVADGYCNSRILKFSSEGKLKQIIDGDLKVPHSLALFDESDVLCVANREGQRVDCMRAGIERPLYANRDETGQKVTTYKGVGRVYAIDAKGTALLTMSGSPIVRGLTIDTASDDQPIIDEWGKNDNINDPHDIAISLTGDAIYVAEITSGKGPKLQKYDVMGEDSNIDTL
jgi:peptidylamidoglycolate lyase